MPWLHCFVPLQMHLLPRTSHVHHRGPANASKTPTGKSLQRVTTCALPPPYPTANNPSGDTGEPEPLPYVWPPYLTRAPKEYINIRAPKQPTCTCTPVRLNMQASHKLRMHLLPRTSHVHRRGTTKFMCALAKILRATNAGPHTCTEGVRKHPRGRGSRGAKMLSGSRGA